MNAADLQKLLDEATPGPWKSCNDGKCSCGQVWSLPGDHPVASATKTPWGDKWYEAAPTADDQTAVDVKFHEYGSFPESQFHANARLIALAPDLARRVIAAEKLAKAARTILDNYGFCSDGNDSYREVQTDHITELDMAIMQWDYTQ